MQGVVSEGDFPVSWGAGKNIAWVVALPGRGSSTPIIVGESIFLTSLDKDQNLVLCFDRSGKLLWKAVAGQGVTGKHRKGTGANPSMVTDGERVFAMFKSGDLVALEMKSGRLVWQKNLHTEMAADTLWWDLGASPILVDNKLIVTCQQSGPSYVAALEPSTGNVLWKVDRILPAPNESSQSYSTPILAPPEARANQSLLVIGGADHVTAHSLQDGKEVWRVGGLNPDQHEMFRSIASPVADGEFVFFPYARGETLTAIRLGGQGDVTESHVAWTSDAISSDVPTPCAKEGKLYVLQDKGKVACLEGASGTELWSQALPESHEAYSSSPILVGTRLYVTREDGTTFVLDTSDKGKILAENSVEGGMVATPVFVDGAIYLRTFESLVCIREES